MVYLGEWVYRITYDWLAIDWITSLVENKLKLLDLYSGIGGFSIAAYWTKRIETVAFCERDSFCQAVLRKHWPNVPIFDDINTLINREEVVLNELFPTIDIVIGGVP